MKTLLVIALCFVVGILGAQETPDNGITSGRELEVQISSLPELKLIFTQFFKIPFLQGNNMLTEGNNLKIEVGGEVTPISANFLFKETLTPIAFFELSHGGRIGSGWTLPLFGMDLYGVGLNKQDAAGKESYSGKGFDGMLWNVFLGGMVQMDFGLLLPWEYDHIVFQSYHEINYSGYSRAKEGESWFYENDGGENSNGFNYYGSILLGYQIPDFWFNTIACLAEMDLYLYDKIPGRAKWGDDLIRWHIAGVLGFSFDGLFDLMVVTQFRTLRNTTDAAESKKPWNKKTSYYRTRTLDTDNPVDFHFYRVAALFTFKLP